MKEILYAIQMEFFYYPEIVNQPLNGFLRRGFSGLTTNSITFGVAPEFRINKIIAFVSKEKAKQELESLLPNSYILQPGEYAPRTGKIVELQPTAKNFVICI